MENLIRPADRRLQDRGVQDDARDVLCGFEYDDGPHVNEARVLTPALLVTLNAVQRVAVTATEKESLELPQHVVDGPRAPIGRTGLDLTLSAARVRGPAGECVLGIGNGLQYGPGILQGVVRASFLLLLFPVLALGPDVGTE